MATSWPKYVSNCKSGLSAIARNCFLARKYWTEKCRELRQDLKQLNDEVAKCEARIEQLEQENKRQKKRIAELEAQRRQPQPLELPLGEAPPKQQYGAGLIALCVNLARKIGLRPVEHVLSVLSEWLGVEIPIPTYQSIRMWMQRIGLDRMQNVKKAPDGVWLADHTN